MSCSVVPKMIQLTFQRGYNFLTTMPKKLSCFVNSQNYKTFLSTWLQLLNHNQQSQLADMQQKMAARQAESGSQTHSLEDHHIKQEKAEVSGL